MELPALTVLGLLPSRFLASPGEMTTPRPPPEGGHSWFVAVGHRPRPGGRANVL